MKEHGAVAAAATKTGMARRWMGGSWRLLLPLQMRLLQMPSMVAWRIMLVLLLLL